MKPAVEEAVDELVAGLPDAKLETLPDANGGAYVRVSDVDLGPRFAPRRSWIAFQITWTCPDADVYPHFICPDVRYVGEGETPSQHEDGDLPASMTRGAKAPGFEEPAVQISRRSNRRNPETDTPLQKLLRVLDWVRSR
jgi:hypothetical protein